MSAYHPPIEVVDALAVSTARKRHDEWATQATGEAEGNGGAEHRADPLGGAIHSINSAAS